MSTYFQVECSEEPLSHELTNPPEAIREEVVETEELKDDAENVTNDKDETNKRNSATPSTSSSASRSSSPSLEESKDESPEEEEDNSVEVAS